MGGGVGPVGADGADRFRGAVLQIPHVGGVPLLIRFRGTHGEQHAVADAGVRHVTPFKRAHFRPPQPAHEQQRGDHGVESAPAVRRGGGFDAPAARAAGIEARVTAHSGRVGLASELTARGASTTEVMLAGNWRTSRMVAHYSAGATAERGAVAKYL